VNKSTLVKTTKTEGVRFRVALDKPADASAVAPAVKYGLRPPAVYVLDASGKVAFQDIALAAAEEAVTTLLTGK